LKPTSNFRVLGRIVLIPFTERKRSPKGVLQQQQAEAAQEEIFRKASSAVGLMISISQAIEDICINQMPEKVQSISSMIPDMDDRCGKNYALLVCLAEKVIIRNMMISMFYE